MSRSLLLLVLALGCSSHPQATPREAPGPDAAGPVGPDAAGPAGPDAAGPAGPDAGAGSSSAFISSYCDLLRPCCAMARLAADGKACRELLGAIAPATYNAAAGEACLRAASQANFCSEGIDNVSACDSVYSEGMAGTRKPGEICSKDDECAPSSEGKVQCRSVFTGGAETRKCQVQVTGREGDMPCVGTVEGNTTSYNPGSGTDVPGKGFLCRVADGLYCDWDNDTCTRFKAIGEACSGARDCGTAVCQSGKCVARKAIGEACMGGFLDDACVKGAFCQESSMTCAAQLGHGAACMDNDMCKSSDCVNGMCMGDVQVGLGLALLCGGN